ncbi:MAG: S-adenosyl-l-methionine hydroxide adenosyltransferase family protein [Sphingomonadaceae bacterium]
MAWGRETANDRMISLLTDFGTADGYVGAMKGVILGLNREAVLVDITHDVAPQDVNGGAFVLHTVHRYFPSGSIHLAVVDPEVGTDRAAVILDTGRAIFVAPDNGLLSYVLAEGWGDAETLGRGERTSFAVADGSAGSMAGLRPVPVPEGWRAVRIAESRYWLPNPSSTFHGRDIFAPVAGYLSLGQPLESFGPPMESVLAFAIPRPSRLPCGELLGEVIHVDRFGNLITNLRAEDLPAGTFATEIAGRRIEWPSRTYAGGRGLVALVGSSSYLEIALPGGSARSELGAGVGAPVRVIPGASQTRVPPVV